MSKFTKEQLVQYVTGCIEHAERFPGVEIADKEKAVFEIALAALTAPAVPDEVTSLSKPNSSYEWRKGWNACRNAMIQEPQRKGGAK